MTTVIYKEKFFPAGFGDYIRDLSHIIEWKLENFGTENISFIQYFTPERVTSYSKDNFENRLLSVPPLIRSDIGITWKFYNTESQKWYQPTIVNPKAPYQPNEKEKAAVYELIRAYKNPGYKPIDLTKVFDVQLFDLKVPYGKPVTYSFIFDTRQLHDNSITLAEWSSGKFVKSNEEYERDIWTAFLLYDKTQPNFLDFFKRDMVVPLLDKVKSSIELDLQDFKFKFNTSKIFKKKNFIQYYPDNPELFQVTLNRVIRSQVMMGPEGGWYHFATAANIPYVLILPSWMKNQEKNFIEIFIDGLWSYTIPTNPIAFIFADALGENLDLSLEKIKKWSIASKFRHSPYPTFFIDVKDTDAVKIQNLCCYYWTLQTNKTCNRNEKYYL